MASTIPSLLLFVLTLLLHPPPLCAAGNLHRTTTLFTSQPDLELTSSAAAAPPTTYFEVTKPIPLPSSKPCSHLLLQHDFAATYRQPPVLADYTPPSNCSSQNFAKIVLEWTATCKGRQFDRIFGVWIGGAEVLRSCTAEPKSTGIVWTVKKDITRYYSLLSTKQTLAVYLGNIVDSTYTGVYHVNITLHFYPADSTAAESGPGSDFIADLILPISRNLPLNDGLWFEIENSSHVESKKFKIPLNTYRAVLEIYVSFHENDEFWYGNPPNEYISANNLTGLPGNGPFREVVVKLDGTVVGAVWPFTVIYTGGVNPLLWRPITGIGSFDLPTYDVEITPFLGKLLVDNKAHDLEFSVTNALNVWYIDANLHLWLDKKSARTHGKLLHHSDSLLSLSTLSNSTGLDGAFATNATRTILSTGVVTSSHGDVATTSRRELRYANSMAMSNNGNAQTLDQATDVDTSVDIDHHRDPPPPSTKVERRFSIRYASDNADRGDGSYESVANVTLGFEEGVRRGGETRRVRNVQGAEGSMLVRGNLVVRGLGSTQQEYGYTSDEWCYFRNVSSSNYTILHDEVSRDCVYHRCWGYLVRRNSLGSVCDGVKKGPL
ncbi:uroporphyrinogen decarboxylase [Salvia divinorum]|uniref:Uroporphyrinogen decarboxylase n=1 Tax=Salvia divinorum TaxID=28513 RepID=A0ABD1HP80_SALDI